MHQWLESMNWIWIGAVLIVWILLIAMVGYAAVAAAWRASETRAKQRRPARA